MPAPVLFMAFPAWPKEAALSQNAFYQVSFIISRKTIAENVDAVVK